MQLDLVFKLLALLVIANGSPIVVKKLFGNLLSCPLDAGIAFIDGRPLFGSSKTVRGILASVAATSAAAPVVGIEWTNGMQISLAAMGGDLASSFAKRRAGYTPSSRCLGLDQIPESFFPALLCVEKMALTIVDVITIVSVFFIGELLVSRLLYYLGLRDEPY